MKRSKGYRFCLLGITLVIFLAGCAGSGAQTPTSVPTLAATAALPTETAVPKPTITLSPTSEPEPAPTESEPAGAETAAPLVTPPTAFDGSRAYQDVEYQMGLGPRTPGSEAHAQVVEWIAAELRTSGWEVEIQETIRMDHPVRNVIAKRGSGAPWSIIGAHFDSRMQADRDPDTANHDQPVPGANDGASGVAVLLELARVLPEELNGEVWLAFFDTEDQGNLPGWDWILGSRAVADSLEGQPDAVIVVDMIGDADLNIYQDLNSNPELTEEVWEIAGRLGYQDQFIPQPKYSMLDDHTPFLEKGIRAIDIIDFDYPYWHTVEDTADKVSPDSLKITGDTVLHWLLIHHTR